ncbi:MAG: hypothetical protein ACOC5A_01885 [Halanaerobiales bacterium]
MLLISGAFGVFRRRYLVEAGGYTEDTVGEDMELVLKLNRYLKNTDRDYRVVFSRIPFAGPRCRKTGKL